MSDAADSRIDELERELRGTQEMLFLVLNAVGEPVSVPVGGMQAAVESGKIIDIVLDEKNNQWVFSIVDVPSE